MQTVNKTEDTQISTIELVLKEILEEQQKANQFGTDLVAAFNQLSSRVESFNEKLENKAITSPPVATKPIEDIMKTGIEEMKIIAAGQPKSITKRYQLLLFPPQDARLFYRIVFGRWFLIIALMFFMKYVYDWAIHQSDINKEMQLQKHENEMMGKAENYLPLKPKKSSKK